MGGLSRTKGASGELELAALLTEITGHRITRRVRQHAGDSDLVGLPGWSVECKRYATAPLALIGGVWWPQAIEQALEVGALPVLFYRGDRQPWRAVWPSGLHVVPRPPVLSVSFTHSLTGDPSIWWELAGRSPPAVRQRAA